MYVLIEFLNMTQNLNVVKFYFRSTRNVCNENRKMKKRLALDVNQDKGVVLTYTPIFIHGQNKS